MVTDFTLLDEIQRSLGLFPILKYDQAIHPACMVHVDNEDGSVMMYGPTGLLRLGDVVLDNEHDITIEDKNVRMAAGGVWIEKPSFIAAGFSLKGASTDTVAYTFSNRKRKSLANKNIRLKHIEAAFYSYDDLERMINSYLGLPEDPYNIVKVFGVVKAVEAAKITAEVVQQKTSMLSVGALAASLGGALLSILRHAHNGRKWSPKGKVTIGVDLVCFKYFGHRNANNLPFFTRETMEPRLSNGVQIVSRKILLNLFKLHVNKFKLISIGDPRKKSAYVCMEIEKFESSTELATQWTRVQRMLVNEGHDADNIPGAGSGGVERSLRARTSNNMSIASIAVSIAVVLLLVLLGLLVYHGCGGQPRALLGQSERHCYRRFRKFFLFGPMVNKVCEKTEEYNAVLQPSMLCYLSAAALFIALGLTLWAVFLSITANDAGGGASDDEQRRGPTLELRTPAQSPTTSESSEGRRGSPGFVSSPGNQSNSDSDENLFELSSCGITLFLDSPATLLDSRCDPFLSWKDVDGEVKHGVDLKQALVALCDLLDAPDPPNVPTGVEIDTTQDFETDDSPQSDGVENSGASPLIAPSAARDAGVVLKQESPSAESSSSNNFDGRSPSAKSDNCSPSDKTSPSAKSDNSGSQVSEQSTPSRLPHGDISKIPSILRATSENAPNSSGDESELSEFAMHAR
jgi:hypothetical protein